MPTTFYELLAITSAMPSRYWAAAFAGILLRVRGEVDDAEYQILAQAARRLLHSAAVVEPDFDLARYGLVAQHLSLPLGPDQQALAREGGPVFLPAYAIFSRLGITRTPQECRIGLGFDEANPPGWATALKRELQEYAALSGKAIRLLGGQSSKTSVTIALLPYHDALEVPLALYMVSDQVPVGLQFVLIHAPEIRRALRERSLDIGYAHRRMLPDVDYDSFPVKEQPTAVPVLWDERTSPESIRTAYDFQGGYSAHDGEAPRGRKFRSTYIFPLAFGSVHVNPFEKEQDWLVALAARKLPKNVCVVPSLQGYMWAKEIGLIDGGEAPDGWRLGGTLQADTSNDAAEDDRWSLFVRLPHSGQQRSRDAAKEVLFALQSARDWIRTSVQEAARAASADSPDGHMEDLVDLLTAPLLGNFPSYGGLLREMPAKLVCDAIRLGERYTFYQPSWWPTLGSTGQSHVHERSAT